MTKLSNGTHTSRTMMATPVTIAPLTKIAPSELRGTDSISVTSSAPRRRKIAAFRRNDTSSQMARVCSREAGPTAVERCWFPAPAKSSIASANRRNE